MSRNSNCMELRTSNYCINYIQDNSNNELKNIEKSGIINQDFYKASLKKENHKNLIINVPAKSILEYKSIKKLNTGRKEKKIGSSIFSPNSKMKISYLKHFNNNSIYYSNHKKNNLSSIYKKSYINTEVKSNIQKCDIIRNKSNANNLINLKKNNKKHLYTKIKSINEDCKNSSSIEDIKKVNIFFKYNILKCKHGGKIGNNIIKNNITSIEEKGNTLKPNKKLQNILSNKNIFNNTKEENNENINTINISSAISKTFKNLAIKKNIIPEKIKPEEYTKINKIGYGSFGIIYKVNWCKNSQNYAMKEMHFQNKDNILYLKERTKYIIDLQKITKCEGIIKVYGDYYFKNGKDYYYYEIMELAERDWEQEIKIRKKNAKYYSEKELFIIMIQLIKTFSLLQKNHITHRDIKLQNILLINQKFKICDFGESRKLNQKGIIVQPVRGSELYMSPILFFGLNEKLIQVKHNTYKSDVFSLGMCILYASTLTQDCLCEIREMTNMENIKNTLDKYLSKKYSNNFIDILLLMLEINEKKRPDFIQLEQFISKFTIKK